MGLKIFESYKDNKHNNSKHNNNTNNSNNNNNTNNSNNNNNTNKDTSECDAKTNKNIITINLDINNDIRDELYSLYIINNV